VFIPYLDVGNSPYHRENIELLYVFTFKVITEVLSTPPSPLSIGPRTREEDKGLF
jgi:hypothetical protein